MATDISISDLEMHQLLVTQLRKGERLQWAMQPRPRRIAAKGMLAGLIGLGWAVYALVMASLEFYSARHSDQPHPAITWNVLHWTWGYLTLLGIGIASTPLWFWRKGKQTVYGVSDQRGIVLERRRGGSFFVRSMRWDGLASVNCRERKDGSGDLVMKPRVARLMRQKNREFARLEFLGIEQVRQVEAMVRRCGGDSLTGADEAEEPVRA